MGLTASGALSAVRVKPLPNIIHNAAMTPTHVLAPRPPSAVALAAALFHGDQIEGDAVICVISGGNVDEDMFARAITAPVK